MTRHAFPPCTRRALRIHRRRGGRLSPRAAARHPLAPSGGLRVVAQSTDEHAREPRNTGTSAPSAFTCAREVCPATTRHSCELLSHGTPRRHEGASEALDSCARARTRAAHSEHRGLSTGRPAAWRSADRPQRCARGRKCGGVRACVCCRRGHLRLHPRGPSVHLRRPSDAPGVLRELNCKRHGGRLPAVRNL